jgi:Cft2 family RNA processing exonuclease
MTALIGGSVLARSWEVIQVRSEAVVDRLLTDAAETLIRNRSRRPQWLPAGFPMKLILSLKRLQLVEYIQKDPSLRRHLYQRSTKSLLGLDPSLVDGVTPDTFEQRLKRSRDTHRFVATAFLGPDDELCSLAAPWVLAQDLIPPPVDGMAPAEAVRPSTSASRRGGRPARRVDALPDRAADELDAPEEPDARDEPAEPSPEPARQRAVDESSRVTALKADVEDLRRKLARAEAEEQDLRSRLPTKNERARVNKQKGELKRAETELAQATDRLGELGRERDLLIEMRLSLEEQLEDAVEARARAERKSLRLEEHLATTEGRARYLVNAIETELTDLRKVIGEEGHGRDRTKATRRVDELGKVAAAIAVAFPTEPEPTSRTRRVQNGRILDLAVTPLGGGEEIGGSCILVEAGGHRVLVDAGLHPDGRGPADIAVVEDGGTLDAIIVTHAHTDHAGYVPSLVSRYPRVPVFCSQATAQLLPTMWADSAKVMAKKAEEGLAAGTAPPPLYGPTEVEVAEERIQEQPFDRVFRIGDLEVTLFVAGHILGAAGVVICGGGQRVVVTGDISGPEDDYLSVERLRIPTGLVTGADLLVIETTYCHANHGSRAAQESGLVSTVRSVVSRRGRVLIPAFGLGRAQEIVMILRSQLPDVDVLLDGMAKEISQIYEKVAEQRGEELTIIGGRVRRVENRFRTMESFQSGVIVSTSGMLTGGPSVEWARRILPNATDALLLCGYQDEEAPGRRLEALANQGGTRKLRLKDAEWGEEEIDVRAEVRRYQLSAHADQRGLVDVVKRVRPKAAMLVHGEPRNQRVFRELLRNQGMLTVPTARWPA